jgi:hypothetical protein
MSFVADLLLSYQYYPFGPGTGHLNSSTSFMQNLNILQTIKITLWNIRLSVQEYIETVNKS